MQLCIVVGAGATFGCGYGPKEAKPPLGRGPDLYRRLAAQYPNSWGSIGDPDVVRAFEIDFETGMTMAWDRQADRTSWLLIDLALFFSEFDPPAGGRDCYTALVRVLRNSRLLGSTAVISLNYDVVLETAASRLKVNLCMNLDRPATAQLLIYKPHGSCNFLPDAPVYGLTVQLSAPGQGYFDGSFRVAQTREVRAAYAGEMGMAIPPIMSVFAPGKHNPVCGPKLEQIREAAARWARDADHVLCIGVRPTLADQHVWDPIIESGATIWFVGGDDEDLDALRSRVGPARLDYLGPYFEDAMPEVRHRIQTVAA